MLGDKFEIWFTDLILNATLFVFNIYVINLIYLEDKIFYLIELLDSSTKELDFGLNHIASISDNDNQPLSDLSD